MKKITLLLAILLAVGLTGVLAQNTWTQKADFGGTARGGAAGFSIGSKGYIGTGNSLSGLKNDFWEYDSATDSWTQKADFGGNVRSNAVGFSIGNKGYLGTGYSFAGPYLKDFWEYDPAANTWTQKANFGGAGRYLAVGFSIGNKGYIGTGANFFISPYYKNDFWEYDPATDTWTQKASFAGTGRYAATGFSIGSKGYIGTGYNANEGNRNDFWEYDPATDSWTQKANFAGTSRRSAAGFSVGSQGYLGTGYDGIIFTNDFWAYDPANNSWVQKANFGGSGCWTAVGFSIGEKGYIGTGESYTKSLWEYSPEASSCSVPANLSVTNITSLSATLNWDAVADAIAYKVRYKLSGTSEWTIKVGTLTSRTIDGLSPSANYIWQLKSICSSHPTVSSDWSEKQSFTTNPLKMQAAFENMFEVYPNPVSQSAIISFSLNEGSNVVMQIIDVNGRSLKVIADENFSEGSHYVTFNRETLAAGIYFLQVKTNEGVMMKKVVIE